MQTLRPPHWGGMVWEARGHRWCLGDLILSIVFGCSTLPVCTTTRTTTSSTWPPSADNAIYAIKSASGSPASGTEALVYQDNVHLHGPIDLVKIPNGDMVVANSDGSNADPNQPSELVEFTLDGKFVAQFSVDKNNGGAFGVGVESLAPTSLNVAAVDDNTNTLTIYVESIF